jgi:hypothetical protein
MKMGRTQIAAIVLASVWVAWTLFMGYAATRSFRTVDRVLASQNRQFQEVAKALGPEATRMVLRHLASEINRTLFKAYTSIQIPLGLVVLLLLFWQAQRDTFALILAGAMLTLALILALVIVPQIVSVGRAIDFMPRHPELPLLARFWMLHVAFTAVDGLKLLAGLVLIGRWISAAPH